MCPTALKSSYSFNSPDGPPAASGAVAFAGWLKKLLCLNYQYAHVRRDISLSQLYGGNRAGRDVTRTHDGVVGLPLRYTAGLDTRCLIS